MRALSLLVAVLLVAGAAPAHAQEPPTVTLEASPGLVTYPDAVQLSGRVDPVIEAESVRILDQEGRIRADATP